MEQLEKKVLQVSRVFTYTYYAGPAEGTKQTLFMVPWRSGQC
jgi:hypothetical protein